MKTTITKLISALALILSCSVFANAQSFNKGTHVISAGIGLGSSLWTTSGGNSTPAISVSFEKGIWEVSDIGIISLGGYLGRTSITYANSFTDSSWDYKLAYTVVGARSAFHYSKLNNNKFDLYGGLMLSYNLLHIKYDQSFLDAGIESNYGASGMGFSGFVGGRYNFSEKLGAFAEVGYGVSVLSFGLSLRF
jgi:hypothetical protein